MSSSGPQISPVRRFRGRFRPRHRPRFKGPSFNRMIPNIMTLLGLCAGLTSIKFAIEGRFGSAVVAIGVAAFIDGVDGRLARLLKAVTRFGAEFDSLADFLCFGVAPALVLYLWSLQTLARVWFHAVPDVCSMHGAAPGQVQRGPRWRALASLCL